MVIVFFIFFLHTLFPPSRASFSFVEIQVFRDSECSNYLVSWIFELGQCTVVPSLTPKKYVYMDDFLDCQFYNKMSESFECVSQVSNQSYPLDTCVHDNDLGVFCKYQVSEEEPMDLSGSKEWAMTQSYRDPLCEQQIQYSDYVDYSGNETFKTGVSSIANTTKLYSGALYCNDDYFCIEYHLYSSDFIWGWKCFFDLDDGECVPYYNDTLFSSAVALSTYCFNEEEFKENVIIPPKEDNFLVTTFFWDSSCGGLPTVQNILPNGYCSGGIQIHFDEERITYTLYYNEDCSGDPYCVESSALDGFCNVPLGDDQRGIRIEPIKDPSLDEGLGMIMVSSCDSYDEKDLKEHVKNRDTPMDYFQSTYCLNKERMSDFIQWPDGAKSIEGKCEEGIVYINNYTYSEICDNAYEQQKGTFCLEGGKGFSFVFTCLPRYCYGVEDYKEGTVCSGNGICTGTNNCSCFSGYQGFNCQDRTPDELKKYLFIFSISAASLLLTLCCVFMICVCLISLPLSLLVFTICGQKKRIEKFNQLIDQEEYYILLEEQKLQKKKGMAVSQIPKLRISKNFFQINYKDIKRKEILGGGGSESTVFLCDWEGREAAFKCFKTQTFCNSQDNFDEFEREISILANTAHPNIIRFYGCCLHPPRIGYLMEYCPNGDLVKYITTNEETLTLKHQISLMKDIASGMRYLHSKNIIHRDLKCQNVLIDEKKVCKIMDFGLSRRFVEGIEKSANKTKKIGTSYYMAPEIVNSGDYDEKCDIFSYSIVCYCILTKDFFPYGRNSQNTEIRVASNPYFRPNLQDYRKYIPLWLIHLIQMSWDHDPYKRPSFREIGECLQENENLINEQNRRKENEKETNLNAKQQDEASSFIIFLKEFGEDDSKADNYFLVKKEMKILRELIYKKWGTKEKEKDEDDDDDDNDEEEKGKEDEDEDKEQRIIKQERRKIGRRIEGIYLKKSGDEGEDIRIMLKNDEDVQRSCSKNCLIEVRFFKEEEEEEQQQQRGGTNIEEKFKMMELMKKVDELEKKIIEKDKIIEHQFHQIEELQQK